MLYFLTNEGLFWFVCLFLSSAQDGSVAADAVQHWQLLQRSKMNSELNETIKLSLSWNSRNLEKFSVWWWWLKANLLLFQRNKNTKAHLRKSSLLLWFFFLIFKAQGETSWCEGPITRSKPQPERSATKSYGQSCLDLTRWASQGTYHQTIPFTLDLSTNVLTIRVLLIIKSRAWVCTH